MLRRVFAECIGTAFLLGTAVGSAHMGTSLGAGPALGLLASSLSTGAILFVLITVLGPVSGAHLNPAVTLAFRARGDISTGASVLYVVAQIIGGILGVWVVHAMFGEPILQVSTSASDGAHLALAEGIATFGLLLTIFGGLKARPEAVPALVGLYITAAYWFTASTSFANPAVTIARTLTDSAAGIAPHSAPAWIAGQLIATAIAAVLLPRLFNEE
jgi:glycerol uptake facilitator-like aquaporin